MGNGLTWSRSERQAEQRPGGVRAERGGRRAFEEAEGRVEDGRSMERKEKVGRDGAGVLVFNGGEDGVSRLTELNSE